MAAAMERGFVIVVAFAGNKEWARHVSCHHHVIMAVRPFSRKKEGATYESRYELSSSQSRNNGKLDGFPHTSCG